MGFKSSRKSGTSQFLGKWKLVNVPSVPQFSQIASPQRHRIVRMPCDTHDAGREAGILRLRLISALRRAKINPRSG